MLLKKGLDPLQVMIDLYFVPERQWMAFATDYLGFQIGMNMKEEMRETFMRNPMWRTLIGLADKLKDQIASLDLDISELLERVDFDQRAPRFDVLVPGYDRVLQLTEEQFGLVAKVMSLKALLEDEVKPAAQRFLSSNTENY